MNNHRKSPRVQEKANVKVRIKSSPDAPELEDRVFYCHSSDVSFGGLQLLIDTNIPIDALLVLEIVFIHTSERFWQTGNVAWCDECVDESLEQGNWYNIEIRVDLKAEGNVKKYQN